MENAHSGTSLRKFQNMKDILKDSKICIHKNEQVTYKEMRIRLASVFSSAKLNDGGGGEEGQRF